MRLSLCLTVRGRADRARETLEHLVHAARGPVECIVAASAGTRLPWSGAEADVTVVRRDGGRPAAAGACVSRAQGEVVVLVQDDVVALPPEALAGWDALVLEAFDARPDVALLGLCRNEPPLVFAAGRSPLAAADGGPLRRKPGDPPAREAHVQDCDHVGGGAMAVRRTDWDRAGGFDDAHAPHALEDADLCARLGRAGRTVGRLPLALVHELLPDRPGPVGPDGRPRRTRAAAMARGLEHFHRRHGDWIAARPAQSAEDASESPPSADS